MVDNNCLELQQILEESTGLLYCELQIVTVIFFLFKQILQIFEVGRFLFGFQNKRQ